MDLDRFHDARHSGANIEFGNIATKSVPSWVFGTGVFRGGVEQELASWE